jgi:D-3-phosphoglycerate dehydrogenase
MAFTNVIADYPFEDLSVERDVWRDLDVVVERIDATDTKDIVNHVDRVDAILAISTPITEAVFETYPELQVVGTYGIGVDHIDTEAASERGVPVVNAPTYCVEEVSTHAAALLLSCWRHLSTYDQSVEHGEWDWEVGAPIQRLSDSTVGFVAFGHIGRQLAEKLDCFGPDLIASDPYLDDVFAEYGVEQVEFDELLARADAISIHAPLTPDTERLFDRDAFRAMRDGAVLVNTSRGGIVDESALVEALDAGKLAAAGLDVFESEPPTESSLVGRDDVVCTPHTAWYSETAKHELRETTAENIRRALTGEPLQNVVNDDAMQ